MPFLISSLPLDSCRFFSKPLRASDLAASSNRRSPGWLLSAKYFQMQALKIVPMDYLDEPDCRTLKCYAGRAQNVAVCCKRHLLNRELQETTRDLND